MKRTSLLLSGLLLGCGSAPDPVAPAEMKALRDASAAAAEADVRLTRTEWHIHLDTRTQLLGAYTVVLHYTSDVGRILEIRPCDEAAFKGAPEFEPSTFVSGTTRVASFDTSPGAASEGGYRLLTVVFERIASGTLEARAEVEKAYDQEDRKIPARVTQPLFSYAFP